MNSGRYVSGDAYVVGKMGAATRTFFTCQYHLCRQVALVTNRVPVFLTVLRLLHR